LRGEIAGSEYLRRDIAGNEYLREVSPETLVCGRHRREQWFAGRYRREQWFAGRYRREQWFAGDIAGSDYLREDIAGSDYLRGRALGTIIFKVYGNFNRPYLRLCLITSAPGSWGKRHGKRFSSPKPPTLSAGAAQIGGGKGDTGFRRWWASAVDVWSVLS